MNQNKNKILMLDFKIMPRRVCILLLLLRLHHHTCYGHYFSGFSLHADCRAHNHRRRLMVWWLASCGHKLLGCCKLFRWWFIFLGTDYHWATLERRKGPAATRACPSSKPGQYFLSVMFMARARVCVRVTRVDTFDWQQGSLSLGRCITQLIS